MNLKDIIIKFVGSFIFLFFLTLIIQHTVKGHTGTIHDSMYVWMIIGAIGLTIATSKFFKK